MAALAGNHVIFGLFEIYGDRSLAGAHDQDTYHCLRLPPNCLEELPLNPFVWKFYPST